MQSFAQLSSRRLLRGRLKCVVGELRQDAENEVLACVKRKENEAIEQKQKCREENRRGDGNETLTLRQI